MSQTSTPRSAPRFNHIAMSVPRELLGPEGQEELLRFYGEVFGWEEMPTLSEPGKRLVLRAYRNDQFVFLTADEKPMTCPSLDHFGMSVSSAQELDEMLSRAKKYRERDDRVEIIERHTEDYGFLKLHNFYVRYRLPMMVEVQAFEWERDASPES